MPTRRKKSQQVEEQPPVATPGGYAASGGASDVPAASFKIGSVIEPCSKHEGTIICLHGLDDHSGYWHPFFAAFKSAGANLSGIRCVLLEAPRRSVWGERMAAWFEYLSDFSGLDKEDSINQNHLLEMRSALHRLMEEEAQRLQAIHEEPGMRRVVLLGSSQGGSMACDAALTLAGDVLPAGVAVLRSLVLGHTAEAARTLHRGARLPLLAVSGDCDDTFDLRLVKRNLAAVRDFADVSHCTVAGLDHMTSYDAEETLVAIKFLAQLLNFSFDPKVEPKQLEQAFPDSAAEKAWKDLNDREQLLAARLIGSHSEQAWDDGTGKVWSLKWQQLSYLQQGAARQLGFTEATWNTTGGASDDPACDKSWADLTEGERELAKKLGVNGANAWDNGTAPVWCKNWMKLTEQQRKAAEQLGFTQKTWDDS
eukprot:TRINITY_DN81266_c0_g1_i1.p1 TRINITY_DN81266_c0_g1~~TRINITY_DN81266_c0_g1_i1.p1  ORF type:complete len:424 (+),score=103.81 TRINITY_DN81266_c0_g1_i1:46-1317(+)